MGTPHDILQAAFNFFIEHQEELVSKYNGRIIVIADQQVIGDYESASLAYAETIKTRNPGTFMIRRCIPGPDAYTQTYTNPNASFV